MKGGKERREEFLGRWIDEKEAAASLRQIDLKVCRVGVRTKSFVEENVWLGKNFTVAVGYPCWKITGVGQIEGPEGNGNDFRRRPRRDRW